MGNWPQVIGGIKESWLDLVALSSTLDASHTMNVLLEYSICCLQVYRGCGEGFVMGGKGQKDWVLGDQ